jgi:hypothetical protein
MVDWVMAFSLLGKNGLTFSGSKEFHFIRLENARKTILAKLRPDL